MLGFNYVPIFLLINGKLAKEIIPYESWYLIWSYNLWISF